MNKFLKRFFLMQFVFVFVYFRYITFDKSVKEFEKRVIFLSREISYIQPYIQTLKLTGSFPKAFKIFLNINIVSAILSILGYKLFQMTSAYLMF